MNTTIEKIQNITSKGQITLPVAWRQKFKTNQIVVRTKNDVLEISPVIISSVFGDQSVREYTVFDAIRDNKGKGIKASDLVKILKKIDCVA